MKPAEVERLNRRAFLRGATATTGGLVGVSAISALATLGCQDQSSTNKHNAIGPFDRGGKGRCVTSAPMTEGSARLGVCKELMSEFAATNFGFTNCMLGSVVEMLDTPPCLVLSLANDEGHTAYCHTDLTHTVPGVLLRWISGKPTFLCNSHFPHDGIFTVAHCSAPRKMNGKDYEPAKIMTHFESDYGAATKVEYTKGQVVTVIIPNLRCTKWQGFRGRVFDSPSHPACRSQIDIAIEGDSRQLLTDMQGFHVQICYCDYLREVGYVLKKIGNIEWQNFS